MDTVAVVRSRFTTPIRTVMLALGDVLAILLFVLLGMAEHGLDLTDVSRILTTTTPFLVGWLLVAVPAGLYGRTAFDSLFKLVAVTVPSWIAASLIGAAIRSTSYVPGGAQRSFVLATIVFGGVILTTWRIAAWLFVRESKRNTTAEKGT